MANEEQLAILRQGVEVWNKWREMKIDTNIDLAYSDLSEADLRGAHLDRANLLGANLSGANLLLAKLWSANLGGARLIRANLAQAELSDADLSRAHFSFANLSETNLNGSKFTKARLAHTLFSFADLSKVIDIDKVVHGAPSSIGRETLVISKGKIPEIFLRGCGLSDWEIESAKLYNPSLTNEEIVKIQYRIYDLLATQAVQIAPLFISYSHMDKEFVDKIDIALTEKGIRFWRDIHNATAGRLETQIDRAIRQNPTVLLVLSKNSIKSDWVEHEVRTARQLEKELGRDALCPIALDDDWKSSPWPKRVMEQVMEYNILDFSDWEDKPAFEGKFAKLLNGLDLFYKKAEE